MKGHQRDVRCSFCGKPKDQVRRLVAGPGVYICDQCVALCNEVLTESAPPPPAPDTARPRGWIHRIFGPKPPHMGAFVVRVPD